MDDVKNQFKGLVKKFNNPFASSSSSRFKGEGHRLGNAQISSQPQPTSQQQRPFSQQEGDWRKPQQERWEKELSSHPRPRQERSPFVSQSQPAKLPISNQCSSKLRISSSSTGAGNESYEVGISDALRTQKIDDVRISDDAISQIHHESNPFANGSQLLDAQSSGNLLLSSSDSLNSIKDDVIDPQKHVSTSNSHVSDSTKEKSSKYAGETINSSHVGSCQNGRTSTFDPFSSQIGSISSTANSDEWQMFQCPVCGSWWRSEAEVAAHVDDCLSQNGSASSGNLPSSAPKSCEDQAKVALGVFLSGGPSSDTINVLVRIIRNIVNSPDLEKFRKIRLSNPKIQDTVGMALGGVEVLEAVGFDYQTEEDEIWAVMAIPSHYQIEAMQAVISELEACIRGPAKEELNVKQKTSMPRKVDRQVRVFYAAPESLAARMELPDSFFRLSAAELRQEAAARKKRLEDSQLLVSKVSREKLAAANKRRYKAAIIRIQFPDGVVLQGMFLPWEPTTAIYEGCWCHFVPRGGARDFPFCSNWRFCMASKWSADKWGYFENEVGIEPYGLMCAMIMKVFHSVGLVKSSLETMQIQIKQSHKTRIKSSGLQ